MAAETFEDIVEDAEQQMLEMCSQAREHTWQLLVQRGAGADVVDEVMTFMDCGLQSALREHLAMLRQNLEIATATRH